MARYASGTESYGNIADGDCESRAVTEGRIHTLTFRGGGDFSNIW